MYDLNKIIRSKIDFKAFIQNINILELKSDGTGTSTSAFDAQPLNSFSKSNI